MIAVSYIRTHYIYILSNSDVSKYVSGLVEAPFIYGASFVIHFCINHYYYRGNSSRSVWDENSNDIDEVRAEFLDLPNLETHPI